jgi:hypothetical protein
LQCNAAASESRKIPAILGPRCRINRPDAFIPVRRSGNFSSLQKILALPKAKSRNSHKAGIKR